MKTGSLYDALKSNGRFQRSVQLVQDWQEQRGLEGYLLSPTSRATAQHILENSFIGQQRTWSLTGPYGTGKSAFALFLADLVSNQPPRHPEAKVLRRALKLGKERLLPVLLVGQKVSIKSDLLLALATSFGDVDQDLATKARKAHQRRSTTARDVVDLYEQAGQQAQLRGFSGIFLVIDEFGKYLEHAAENGDEDLFVMQAMGEAAARSEFHFIVVTILHSAFADYLSDVDHSRRAEWRKVQGRYADLAFLEPPEQFLRLLGSAIAFKREHENLRAALEKEVVILSESEVLAEARQRIPLDKLLPACAPLHPLTALILWPLFRSTLSQNERSLFAFLTDGSPFGFPQFLRNSTTRVEDIDLYPLHSLYDYLSASLGDALLVGLNARRWGEIDNSLARVPAGAPPLSAEIIKTVGILSIFGGAVGLKATLETIHLAFPKVGNSAVDEVVEYLKSHSIMVFRRFENAYGLWEGSDVDLDASYALARKQLRSGELADRLGNLISVRPLVARAHYIRTGTLRYLDVAVIDGNEETMQRWSEDRPDTADGQLVFVLSENNSRRNELTDFARTLAKDEPALVRPLIWAFPKPMARIELLIAEVESWRWIQANVPELQGDPVARAEVRAHEQQSLRLLLNAAGQSLGLRGYVFQPRFSEWIYAGKTCEFKSAVEFQRWLSRLCDSIYESAPPLRNELLNREILSSAAAAARRKLIEAMLAHEADEQLGMQGFPAEYSMYRSMVREGGFHRKRGGNWTLGEPNPDWRPVWQGMKAFLRESRKGRLPITDLAHRLQSPPYGLRSGPLPVLLTSFVLTHRDTVALYEEGVLIPELRIEVFERLMRAPERFELQWYSFNGRDKETLAVLQQAIADLRLLEDDSQQVLIALAKGMVLFLAGLPLYAKTTKRLKPQEAIIVREELARAGDPYKLIFESLPQALGVEGAKEHSREYAGKLKSSLVALQRAYPRLLDQIETYFKEAFSLKGNAKEIRDRLVLRSAPLIGHSADPTLSLFISESQRLGNRDWREVLGRVVNAGIPPDRWRDRDVVDFQVKIRQLAADFLRLEELIAERGLDQTSTIFRIGLLDGHYEEQRALVSVPAKEQERVDALASKISDLLINNGTENSQGLRIRIAALAKAAAQLIAAKGEEEL